MIRVSFMPPYYACASAEASDCLNALVVSVAPETVLTFALCAAMASWIRIGIAWLLMLLDSELELGYERNEMLVMAPPEMVACTWTGPRLPACATLPV